MTSALEVGGWSAPHADRFTPDTRCTRGWVDLGGCLDGTENLVFTGIRYPDRPSRCEPLYRLRHLRLPELQLLSPNFPVRTKENNEAHQDKRSSGRHWILGLSRYEGRVLIPRPRRWRRANERNYSVTFLKGTTKHSDHFVRRQAVMDALTRVVSGCPPV
jgi:hypothetical protein